MEESYNSKIYVEGVSEYKPIAVTPYRDPDPSIMKCLKITIFLIIVFPIISCNIYIYIYIYIVILSNSSGRPSKKYSHPTYSQSEEFQSHKDPYTLISHTSKDCLYSKNCFKRLQMRVWYSKYGSRVRINPTSPEPSSIHEESEGIKIEGMNRSSGYRESKEECPLRVIPREKEFGFKVVTQERNVNVFESVGLSAGEGYLQIGSTRNEEYRISGVGMEGNKGNLGEGMYRIWNSRESNLHPFLLFYSMDNLHTHSFGIYMDNYAPMEIQISREQIMFKLGGGVIDLHFLYGPSPMDVIRNYHKLIGCTMLPTLSALGWTHNVGHIQSLDAIYHLHQEYINQDLPLDGLWLGASYLQRNRSFTLAPEFEDLAELMAHLQENKVWVYGLINANIEKSGYAYREGRNRGLLVNLSVSTDTPPVEGMMDGTPVVYVNFLHEGIPEYWRECVLRWSVEIGAALEGYELGMNQPYANTSYAESRVPIWRPKGRTLEWESVPLYSMLGNSHHPLPHIAMHNAYPLYITHHSSRVQTHRRSILLTEATAPGIGRWAGHLHRGNTPNNLVEVWVTQVQGIGWTGREVECGGSPQECVREHQIAALYPLSRSAHIFPPLHWGEEAPQVMQDIKAAVTLKYSLLIYIYTQMWNIHIHGGTLWTPLCFPGNTHKYSKGELDILCDVWDEFWVGDALIVAPHGDTHSKGNATSYPILPSFPIFFDLYTGQRVTNNNTPPIPDSHIPLFLAGGHILPIHSSIHSIRNVYQLLGQPIDLIIALDLHMTAKGFIVVDDGHHKTSDRMIDLLEIKAHANNEQLTLDVHMIVCRYNKKNGESYLRNIRGLALWGDPPSQSSPHGVLREIVINGGNPIPFGSSHHKPGVKFASTDIAFTHIPQNPNCHLQTTPQLTTYINI